MSSRIIESIPCQAKTKAGKPCMNKTKKGNKCYIHLLHQDNLRIKKSNIPQANLGLFSGKNKIPKGRFIVDYNGYKENEPSN